MAKRIDLKISFACNNRCLFCVQGKKREIYMPKSMEQIKKELQKGRKGGASDIVLTGGEPTINKNIFEIVRMAKKTGYADIQIQTNGRMFQYYDFCKEMKAAGATEIAPALHGSCPEIHDFLTGCPGAFSETAKGIINAKKAGFRVITNSVITKPNQQDLPRLAKLLCALGADQFQMAFAHILGSAKENSKWLAAKISVAAPFIRQAMDIGRKNGVKCFTEAVTYCFMQGYEQNISERVMPSTHIFDAETEIEDFKACRLKTAKTKGPGCHKCYYFNICEGPWKEYPELFGWDEFEPVQETPHI
ncbi:MAG: radical SAM protein [Elusimicrobiales bacterium]|nr:radical SAM protein [Elusimicrobiales bacterium]